MNLEASPLPPMLEGIVGPFDGRELHDALRWADRTRRRAPDNRNAMLTFARLLLADGQAAAAVEALRGWEDPESLLLQAEAAMAAGSAADAIELARQVLWNHAANSLPHLAMSARRVCREAAGQIPGWMGIDSNGRLVGELTSARSATIEWGTQSLGRIVVPDPLPGAFAVPLPGGLLGAIRVRVGDRELLGSGLRWPIDFGPVGWVVLEGRQLGGEVHFDWNRHASLTLVLTSGRSETSFDIAPAAGAAGVRSFSRRLNDIDLDDAEVGVALRLPDGRVQALLGSPLRIVQPAPRPVAEGPWSVPVPRAERDLTRKVHIVIPVRSGIGNALPCLRSVLSTTSRHRALVTVVDEASTEAEIREVIAALGRQGARLEVLGGAGELSGARAVTFGVQHHPELDVVLLETDTEVCPGWLERFCAAAYSKPEIGTVITLTDAARLAGHALGPIVAASLDEAARLDRIAREVNARVLIDVPVAVNACLYIKRQCLDEVGAFDDRSFDEGYGELTDFCLRARGLGWRHVAHAGIVTRWRESKSPGPAGLMKLERNHRLVNHRHPGYDSLLGNFRRENPLRAPQRAIGEGRLIAETRAAVLLVSLADPGGIRSRIEARIAALARLGVTALWLRTASKGVQRDPRRLRLVAPGGDLTYEVPQEWQFLRALLCSVGPTRIEIYDRSGLETVILKLVMALGVPYHVIVHDYSWVCPRRTFVTGGGEYCGEPAVATCEHCVDRYGALMPLSGSVTNWRRRAATVLAAAARVLVPSRDAAARLARHIPGLEPIVEAADERIELRPRSRPGGSGPVRVLLLGDLNPPKGYAVLFGCAQDAARRQLALEFVVVGTSCDDAALLDTGRVFVTGPHRDDEIPLLLDRERCDVALFPGIAPEVWCDPLSLVLAMPLPVVALDLGAVAERLRQAARGVLLPIGTPAAVINDALLQAAAARGDANRKT